MDYVDGDRVVGAVGLVTTKVGGGKQAGEVRIPFRGGTEAFIAYASDPIDRGAQVLVVGRRPGRVVDVIPFSD